MRLHSGSQVSSTDNRKIGVPAYSTMDFAKLDKAWYTEKAIGVIGGTNGNV
jgi:hypothetical protein